MCPENLFLEDAKLTLYQGSPQILCLILITILEYLKKTHSEETIEAGDNGTPCRNGTPPWNQMIRQRIVRRVGDLKRLNNDPTNSCQCKSIMANQIAHQLLLNGRVKGRLKCRLPRTMEGDASVLTSSFYREEPETVIQDMKNGIG